MPNWGAIDRIVRLELTQLEMEGYDVTGFAEKIEQTGKDSNKLESVYRNLRNAVPRNDFPFYEPDEWEDIQKLRPAPLPKRGFPLERPNWRDKMYGALLGRCSGCALGMPLEHGPYEYGTSDTPGWKNIERWFKGADAWPIRNYTPEHSRAEQEYGLTLCPVQPAVEARLEHLRYMPTDDDIRYVILSLLVMERKGFDFNTRDVGKLWHEILSYGQVHSAEGQAYINFANALLHITEPDTADWESIMHEVRTWLNPYREWIGAYIRVDGYAYAAAGNPELAAQLAYRDASFSHTKNGIYGAIFMAAMISAAFVETDMEDVIQCGLQHIPSTSRLAKDIQSAISIARKASGQLDLAERLHAEFGHYHPVHTNNNAAVVAAALVFGGGDFEKSITTAVQCGWDVDCNGATVGSILGAFLGADSLPAKWIEPLQDILYSDISGFHPIRISACAERFLRLKEINNF